MEAVSQCTPQLGPDMSNQSKIAAQRSGYKRQGKKKPVISNLLQKTTGNVPDVARLRTQARPMQGKIAQHGANSAALATRRIILLRYAGIFPRLRWPKNQQMTLGSQAKVWLANQWTRTRFFGKASQTKISCDRQQQISTANHQASQMETKKCKM